MHFDVNRLHHLRTIHKDRLATFRAAYEDSLELRERLHVLERDRQRIVMNRGEGRELEALDALDKRIATVKADLAGMNARCDELAAASTTAGRTFQAALELAQAQGLPLPEDLKPRNFGAPAAPAVQGGA